jgi:haloalkane dehalogenase
VLVIFQSCKTKTNNLDVLNLPTEYRTYYEFGKALEFFNSADGKLAYLDKGTGPIILLMHGVPTSSWLYRKVIPQLVKNGYRVIAPDMLGYGASDKPEGYEIYSDENMAKRTLALMDHLKIENWAQVFHDGGGLWTWHMLKQDPSRINHLFMLNTIVYEDGFKPPIRMKPGKIAGLFARMYTSKAGQKIVLDQTFKQGVNNGDVVTSEMLKGYRKPFMKSGHGAIYYFFTQTCNQLEDFSELHKSLDIPTTVIWGKNDVMLVWENIKDQVMANFNLLEEDIHVVDGKHFIQEEQPGMITEIILKDMKRS